MAIQDLLNRYPRLPELFANTLSSKMIQYIKTGAIDPAFEAGFGQKFAQLSSGERMAAEWVFHLLSGFARMAPPRTSVLGIIAQEALAESLTQIGIKIADIKPLDYATITVQALPLTAGLIRGEIRRDPVLKSKLAAFFGTSGDWATVLGDGEKFLDEVQADINARRAARQARGWRRFLPWTK